MSFSASQIGYVTQTLSDPTAYAPSQIGYATATLVGPAVVTYAASPVGYVTATLSNPIRPVAVRTTTGLKYVPIRTWDGSTLR